MFKISLQARTEGVGKKDSIAVLIIYIACRFQVGNRKTACFWHSLIESVVLRKRKNKKSPHGSSKTAMNVLNIPKCSLS